MYKRQIYDQFCDKFVARVAALKVGDGSESDVQIGPLINADAGRKVQSLLDDALSRGATPVSYTHLDVYKRQPMKAPSMKW